MPVSGSMLLGCGPSSSALLAETDHVSPSVQREPSRNAHTPHRTRKYGSRFNQGFLDFYKQGELTDVTVEGPDGVTYHVHMLLLAYHSEFFRRLFNSNFRESNERHVKLGFEDSGKVWSELLQYFYTEEIVLTDENVLALLALSRELMVAKIQEYCADFVQNSLESSNAIEYLNQAVQFNCEGFRESCISLVAEGFPTSYEKSTDRLPVDVILEILQNPELCVQTEEQVLTFVLSYVRRHALEPAVIRSLFEHVRLPFLSNQRLAQLMQEECLPQDMLLAAMATRLQILDHPEKLGGSCALTPRKTYVCSIEYGLPGGCEYVAIPIEAVWEELVGQLRVKVSGDVVEGDAESILRVQDDSAWFMVSGDATSSQQPVWVELEFPETMRVVELTKFTFSHGMNFANHMFPYGISDSAWFQMKGMITQVSPGEGAPFTALKTIESCQVQLEYNVAVDGAAGRVAPWRRMRLTPEDGGLARLSIRKLKLYGRVEVSLTRRGSGKDLLALWRRRKESRMIPQGGGDKSRGKGGAGLS